MHYFSWYFLKLLTNNLSGCASDFCNPIIRPCTTSTCGILLSLCKKHLCSRKLQIFDWEIYWWKAAAKIKIERGKLFRFEILIVFMISISIESFKFRFFCWVSFQKERSFFSRTIRIKDREEATDDRLWSLDESFACENS